ncbi:PROTEIN RALF-LIKE 15-RELATED [Salix koriyanagi]|uniref:PROTEIN RALF-LIKE 15-RELATED n=1 Tax=Salix koriyanagi TaxID=2511006 RepID=A0A9Q0W1Q7_9ROSI|nr:PROTEIN RALF-LIKE 15-RELATED [Salix koriyanagi]
MDFNSLLPPLPSCSTSAYSDHCPLSTMSPSSKLMALGLCMLMVCTLFAGNAEATKYIGYGAIGRGDHEPECGPKNPCVKPPSDGYHRGCEAIYKCRGGGRKLLQQDSM